MELPDPDDKNFVKVLNLKQSVMSSVMTATTRARSGDLRGQDDDGVDGFLMRLRMEAGEEPDPSILFDA